MIIWRSDCRETLLVTTVMLRESEWMKSTKISDFAFFKDLLMLVMWVAEFLMNLALLSLLIGIITCFLEGPFVIIWMQCFSFIVPLTILLIWSIFFTSIEENASLILIILEVLMFYLKTWAYNMVDFLRSANLLFLKYFEIILISWIKHNFRSSVPPRRHVFREETRMIVLRIRDSR